MRLDFETAERLIFQEGSVTRSLPEFKYLFDQYHLSLRVPALRELGRRSILDFLAQVRPEQLARVPALGVLEVESDIQDFQVIRDLRSPPEGLCDALCGAQPLPNYTLTRDHAQVRVLFWR